MMGCVEAAAIVVGAGPAGLFLAARLARETGKGVILLERGPKPGRKLLASGSGQCNITHGGDIADFPGKYGRAAAGRFLKKALYAFANAELEEWFIERGLVFETEEGGKVFPASRRAAEVLDVLLAECRESGVDIRAQSRVKSVRTIESGFEVGMEGSEGPRLRSRLLALATGGMSYPLTGSTGDGYRIAAALGHRIVDPRPALSPVIVEDFALGELAGVGFEDIPFVVRRSGAKPISARGDILVTREGFSGPGILDASRLMSPGDGLEPDFSGMGFDLFREELARRSTASPRSLVKNVLADAGLPKRMAGLFCSLASVDRSTICAALRREGREALLRMATAYPARIRALGGFDKAMVTAGGVSLDEVDPATMESRIEPGLFFAGEILDYDGDTGGYNLQAAFSTAAAAALGMASKGAAR
jgi:predicted Rossmann fold flavoprotein